MKYYFRGGRAWPGISRPSGCFDILGITSSGAVPSPGARSNKPVSFSVEEGAGCPMGNYPWECGYGV